MYKGPIAKGYYVCHTCDVPKCVNPAHLFLGTQKDNIKDMMEKGRHPEEWVLNAELVLEARRLQKEGASIPAIARLFKIKYDTLSKALRGITWGNV